MRTASDSPQGRRQISNLFEVCRGGAEVKAELVRLEPWPSPDSNLYNSSHVSGIGAVG